MLALKIMSQKNKDFDKLTKRSKNFRILSLMITWLHKVSPNTRLKKLQFVGSQHGG